MKAAGGEPFCNGVTGEPKGKELPAGEHSVLLASKIPSRAICSLVSFTGHRRQKRPMNEISPPGVEGRAVLPPGHHGTAPAPYAARATPIASSRPSICTRSPAELSYVTDVASVSPAT